MQFDCPICNDECIDYNFIMFKDCGHVYCKSCSTEIILEKTPKCALDCLEIKNIEYKSNDIMITTSISKYINDIIIASNYQTLIDEVESNRSFCIIQTYIIIQFSYRSTEKTIEILQKWLNKNQRIGTDEIDDLCSFISITQPNILGGLFDKIQWKCNRCDLLCVYFSKESNTPISPLKLNLKLNRLLQYLELLQDHLSRQSYFCLFNRKIHQSKFITNMISILENDLQDMLELYDYIIAIVISFFEQNQEIFKIIHSNFTNIETDKCLICKNVIETNLYANFTNCIHKICSKCMNRFLLTQLSCPIDGQKFNNLNIGIRNSSDYLIDNIDDISEELLNDMCYHSVDLINSIIRIQPNFAILILKLKQIQMAFRKTKINKNQILKLFYSIKRLFEQMQNHQIIRNYDLSTIKYFYRSILFKRFIDMNHCFKSMSVETIDKILLTNNVIFPWMNTFNNFLTCFDHLQDQVFDSLLFEDFVNTNNVIETFFENYQKVYQIIKLNPNSYRCLSISFKESFNKLKKHFIIKNKKHRIYFI